MQHFPLIETQAAIALDDLGWNDMGEADEPRHPADILPLTPAPKLPEISAETVARDRKAAAQLAENARQIAETGSIDTNGKPQVVLQREEIAVRLEEAEQLPAIEPASRKRNGSPAPAIAGSAKKPSRSRGSALAEGRRAAFTLRLDGERHLKLRLASTILNCSAQQFVTKALDALLDEMPELETLAAQVKRR